MEQKEFLNTIRTCRRRLNMAELLKKSMSALSIGAGAGFVFQAAAFVLPLYYANLYTGLALLFAMTAAFAVTYAKRITMTQAALTMDGFGFRERIVTAYEHLSQEGALISLQRQDAMNQLAAHKDRIRIPLWPSWKKTVLFLGLFAVLSGLILTPSATKDRARELHQIQQEAGEKEKEIEEVIEALEQLSQEELSPEQSTALQEMIESLQSSLSEYRQAASAEMLAAATDKLNYKYENMSSQLANLAQSLQSGAAASVMSTEAMQAVSEKLQQMSGNANQASNGQGGGSQDGNGGQNGQGSNGSQNGQSGNGSQNGQGSQSGQGDGNGQGDGSGQNGQGNGNGQSGDGGSGGGRGTGSSDALHDYVSVPNAIADSGNLTGNVTNHDASEYFRAQNGLSWEGTHISHEAVIGSYEQNAYEGIAAGRYPSGMEDVIKDYFSSFND